MKRLSGLILLLVAPVTVLAQAVEGFSWEAWSARLEKGLLDTLIYVGIGFALLALAFKMKDLLLPGKLSEQLVKEKNMAVAVVTAAYLLAIGIIIAAAITG